MMQSIMINTNKMDVIKSAWLIYIATPNKILQIKLVSIEMLRAYNLYS